MRLRLPWTDPKAGYVGWGVKIAGRVEEVRRVKLASPYPQFVSVPGDRKEEDTRTEIPQMSTELGIDRDTSAGRRGVPILYFTFPSAKDGAKVSAIATWERPPYRATGYQMIKSVDIKNFRCFHNQALPDCRRVNVIVGENGSGKTSLLEALFLVGGPSPEITFRLRQWRGFEGGMQGSQRQIEKSMWSDLFHNFDTAKSVSIAASGDDVHTRRLTVTYVPTDVYVQLSTKGRQGFSGRAPVTFRWNMRGQNPISITPQIEEGALKIPPVPEAPTEVFFFAANHTYSSLENVNRFSTLSKTSDEGEFTEPFIEQYPDVEKITLEMFAGNPMVYAKKRGFKEKVALNLLSGGMNKLAAIMLSFPTSPRCIVLIDEIENGFYYRRLPSIWKLLLDFSKKYDAQIFASTHSGECLSSAASLAAEHPGDFSVIHAGSDGLQQFHGDKFVFAMRENIEIR